MALKVKGGQFTPEAKAQAKQERELALVYQMRTPQGLSPHAEWVDLKPANVPLWEWWQLYDDDKELWPYIVEIAKED